MIIRNTFLDITLQVMFGFLYTITNKKALLYHDLVPITISICQLFIAFNIAFFIFLIQNKKFNLKTLVSYKKFIPLSIISCGSHIFSIYVINFMDSSSSQLFKFFIPLFSIFIGYLFYNNKFKFVKIFYLLIMSQGIYLTLLDKNINLKIIIFNIISNIFTAFKVYEIKNLLDIFYYENELAIFIISIFFTLFFSFPFILLEKDKLLITIYQIEFYKFLYIIYSGVFYFLFYGLLNISLKNNTPLTQSVSGLVAKIFNVLGSIIFFKEKINKLSIFGYCITFFGLVMYFVS